MAKQIEEIHRALFYKDYSKEVNEEDTIKLMMAQAQGVKNLRQQRK